MEFSYVKRDTEKVTDPNFGLANSHVDNSKVKQVAVNYFRKLASKRPVNIFKREVKPVVEYVRKVIL